MRLSKFVLVCGVVALMAAPALAQRQPGGGGGFGTPGTTQLLQNKSVQKEMKLDADTVTKITDAVKKVQDDESLKDARQTMRDRQASQEDRAAARKKISDAETKALSGVLKSDQEKRLKQIRYYVMGLAIFNDEEAGKALKLTDEQKEKVKEVSDGLAKDMQGLRPGAGGGKPDAAAIAEMQKKMQTLRKEAMTSATKALKDDQKTTLKELTGEPFEYTPEFGGFGGGGKPGGKPGDKPRTDF